VDVLSTALSVVSLSAISTYCSNLQEQMEDRVEQQRRAKLEHERERGEIDEVMRAIDEEDRLQVALKHRKAAETMEYIRAILSEREERREFDRRTNEEEERKIQVPFPTHDRMNACAHVHHCMAASQARRSWTSIHGLDVTFDTALVH
jgi:Trichohyalin-plectin-homology domain